MIVGGRLRAPLAVAAGLLGVYLLGTWAVWFTPQSGSVAFWWPAGGVAVGMVALAPRAWWPMLAAGVMVASLLSSVTAGRDLDVALAFAVANAAEAVIAGLLLKDDRGRLRELTELRHFVRLVLAAVAGAAAAALLAGATVVVADGAAFLPSVRGLFASHSAAVLVIVPVAMTRRLTRGVAAPNEYAVQLALFIAVTLIVFIPQHALPIAAVGMPLLVWAALRLDPRTVALELLGNALLALALTSAGRGPYGDTGPGGDLSPQLATTLVLGYVLTCSLVALPLTLAITQRARTLRDLGHREALFRRNFTMSLTGMLLLTQRGDRLEIIDANDPARELLDEPGRTVVGRYLDRILTEPTTLRGATQTMLSGDLDGWRGHVGIAHRPGSHVDVAISQISSDPEATFSAQLLDVTALHQSLARTVEAERLTSTLLDTARCLMLMTDMDGTVLRVNHATTVLTGFDEDQIVGHPFWTTIATEHRREAVRQMFADDAHSLPGSQETDVRTRQGDPLRIVWNTEVVRDDDGTPRYAVLTGVDVTAERASAGLMATLFQAGISTAIIGLDAQGGIRLLSSGAEAMLGYGSEDLQGRPFVDLLDPSEVSERTGVPATNAWSALTSNVENGTESVPRDWTWLSATGRRRTVEMTISQGGRFGSQAGFLVVGRDVTEQRHGQLMLMAALDKERMAADRLRKLDAAKNEFVSTVSHELRTPVTSIVGYTEMLADGAVVEPDPQQVPLLETIARNGDRLIALCNDLLSLAGLDSGGAEWDRAEVDVSQLVRHTEESLRPLLRDRQLQVTFEVCEPPLPVLGDAVQLERVLLNLMSNAVKFTPDGGRVWVRLHAEHDEAVLTVRDTGIGIPTEEQDELFHRFFRTSTAQAMAIQGTGLGLSIVAGIVAAHGGRIGVESAHGEGSTFTVRLPLRP